MRKLMVGVLALGGAALLAGTIAVSMPTPVGAQGGENGGFRPDYEGCRATQLDDDFCNDDVNVSGAKVLICHFNEGADFGKAHCQEPGGGKGGYESHIGPLGHGQKDFCIRTPEEIDDCLKGIIPPK
jgi:hypothetical protein